MYGPRPLLEEMALPDEDHCWPDTVAADLHNEGRFLSAPSSLAPATPVPPSAWAIELPPSLLPPSLQAKHPPHPSLPPRPPHSSPPPRPSSPPHPSAPPASPSLPKKEASAAPPKKITIRTIRRMKEQGEKICMLTAYDAVFGRLVDQAGAEMILVGDSLGMVIQGADHTLAVTLEDMIYHTRCVARVAQRSMIVADMPFMTYQVSPIQALESAGRLIKEGGAHAVKLEGGEEIIDAVSLITRAGIPVVGHLGLTPQSVHAMGGFVVQGRDPARAEEIRRSALALQHAGAFALVLEGIPSPLASEISKTLAIPTIGIGAGNACDGQVLVIYDLLGLSGDFKPRFVKRFADLSSPTHEALATYCREVKQGSFPDDEHSFF